MKEKNLYQIRGKAVEADIKDKAIVDKLSILLPPTFLSKNNTDRKKILDKIGLKYLIKDIYKDCKCPNQCEPCPLDAPTNKGLKYLLDEIAKMKKQEEQKRIKKREIQKREIATQTDIPVKKEKKEMGTQYSTYDLDPDEGFYII